MKRFLKGLLYKLAYKRVDENSLEWASIALRANDVLYFTLSTNVIASFEDNGKLYYFRECPIISRKTVFFKNSISSFFKSVDKLGISDKHFKEEIPIKISFSPSEIADFKRYLEKRCENDAFIKGLSSFDVIASSIGFSIWQEFFASQEFFEKFGFFDVPDALKDITLYFIWYMRSCAVNYRILKSFGKGRSFFSAQRAIASKIVAEELGVGDMISTALPCRLTLDDGSEMTGVVSDAAEGSRMRDTRVELNGSLQRELLILNALDLICWQVDHGPNNYNVYSANGEYKICAFDNDNQQTFFPISNVRARSLSHASPLIKADGAINRPFFDREFSQKIHNVNKDNLKKRLKPYLNSFQINALIKRIEALDVAIYKTQESNPSFLIDSDKFSADTAVCEFCGDFGETYLLNALK